MRFELATAARIVFGPGRAPEAGAAAAAFGRHAFLVTGRDPERSAKLRAGLGAAGVAATVWTMAAEPSIDAVEAATAAARASGCDLVVGFGGGSALDAAKTVAALVPNPGPITDYLEVIGAARPLSRPSLPCLAIPTTAGTGAEVTRNAVLTSKEHRLKVSLRGSGLLPRLALVDPELTRDLPPALTASTGLDALTQLIEPFVCNRANPLTDGICREGLGHAARSLRRAVQRGDDAEAREGMALASLFGGLALANSGLGAAHGFASPVGGRFGAPHGAVCGALLAPTMAGNLRAARRRTPDSETERRYAEVAALVTGRPGAAAEDGIAWVRALIADLGIPGLGAYGIVEADAAALAAEAAGTSSMKANPVALSPAELREILLSAL